jgi:hypothetical protein
MVFGNVGNGQAVDIIAARREHACDAGKRSRFIIDGKRQHMPFGDFF